ncbi:hypothetical protein L9F63_017423, partial [Diploptera punctata]
VNRRLTLYRFCFNHKVDENNHEQALLMTQIPHTNIGATSSPLPTTNKHPQMLNNSRIFCSLSSYRSSRHKKVYNNNNRNEISLNNFPFQLVECVHEHSKIFVKLRVIELHMRQQRDKFIYNTSFLPRIPLRRRFRLQLISSSSSANATIPNSQLIYEPLAGHFDSIGNVEKITRSSAVAHAISSMLRSKVQYSIRVLETFLSSSMRKGGSNMFYFLVLKVFKSKFIFSDLIVPTDFGLSVDIGSFFMRV